MTEEGKHANPCSLSSGALNQEDSANQGIIFGKTNHARLAQSRRAVPFVRAAVNRVFGGFFVASVAGSSVIPSNFDEVYN